MKRLGRILGTLLFVTASAACGDDGTGDGGSGGGTTSTTTSGTGSTTSSSTTATGSTSTGGQMLQAPVLDTLEQVHGALHVFWTNVQTDCDSVEGERRDGASAMFQMVFTVPGTVDNKADNMANDPMVEYTYRLRCKKGADYSPYSNELSAMP